jgi:hypothetical protein
MLNTSTSSQGLTRMWDDKDDIGFGFDVEFDIKKDTVDENGNLNGVVSQLLQELFEGDDSDDENRKFFEALSSGFSQRGKELKANFAV